MKITPATASQKILLLAVAASAAGHLLLISATGFVMRSGVADDVRPVSIELREASGQQVKQKTGLKKQPDIPENADSGPAFREETVDLGDSDNKFAPYLKKTRDKLNALWDDTLESDEFTTAGDVVVGFSLDRSGRLYRSSIVKSSGFDPLDRQALNIVRTAAPFHPFTADMKLARLHIFVTFKYRTDE